jgi:hypothetical protein
VAETAPAAGPLHTGEVARLLRAVHAAVLAESDQMRPAMAAFHPAAGEWCVKECIGHMIEAERRGFAGRIRLILEEPGRSLQGWDQVEVQAARKDCEKDLADVVREFADLRQESVALVDGLMNTDMLKSGEHAQVGTLTVEDLLHEWIHHDRNHLRQLQANVQAYVWPSMGNARRFAEVD